MKSVKKAILFGFLVWLIPFVIAVVITPIRTNQRALFESIMVVVVTGFTALFAILYFQKVEKSFVKEGVILGVVWFVISIVIDLLMFMWGPMKMSFLDYMADIGLTYLIIPIVTISFGYLLQKRG